MFGSEILEVAIGLVFVYLFASLTCSGIMELIAKILKLRSKHLKEELSKLLKSEDLVNALYQSPLLKEISRGFTSGKAKNGTLHPDNIPTDHFVTALIDMLLDMDKDKDKEKFAADPHGCIPGRTILVCCLKKTAWLSESPGITKRRGSKTRKITIE